MFTLAIILNAACITLSTAICSDIPSGLYCTHLENNTNNKILISQDKTHSHNDDVQVIYLRNSSGAINEETFSKFSTLKSLDVQFSRIDNISLEATGIATLYLTYNSKLPTLSSEFIKQCCQHLSILFIVDNDGLKIEAGAFKYVKHLTHLTISKQNITSLTKDFFEGLEKLTYLNLKENGILAVVGNAFENLTELNHLILSYNNFTVLEPFTFQNLKVLEAVELNGLNFTDFNISIFNNQIELKVLVLPSMAIKEKLDLNKVIKTLPKLETLGFQSEDREDSDVLAFINKCKASGYNIKFSNRSDI